MDNNRRTATMVGVLYIVGTVLGILSVALTAPILSEPDYLLRIPANESQVVVGVLCFLAMGLALAMVPVLLFSTLKKYSEALALGYLVFRGALETVAVMLMVVSRLFLVVVSQEYLAAGAPAASSYQTLGAVLLKGHDAVNPVMIIIFSLDALMLYYVLYQSRLVPRWLSIWGFIAISLHFATAFLLLFGLVGSGVQPILFVINFPIFVQEMVMAVWLIARGFNPSALAPAPPQTAVIGRLR